jgi:hypothetical protein
MDVADSTRMIPSVAERGLLTLGLAGASFVACQVYDASLLTGAAGDAGRGASDRGGTAGVSSGPASGGIAGSTSGGSGGGLGGDIGSGGTLLDNEAGAGGEGDESSGGTGGSGATAGVGGKSGTGGVSGAGGKSGTGGMSGAGGAYGTGGVSGKAGSAGAGGKGGTAGTSATGGAGTGGSGAGNGGGAGKGGASGSGGSAPTVVELSGTASADSEQAWTGEMHPAALGNDGDPLTRWCAANGNANHYWTVDLGAVHEVTRFEVTWEYPAPAAGIPYLYRIDISSNGTTFTQSVDKTANMSVMATQSVNFPAGTMARHVRVVVTGPPTGAWASFFEASVYGY